MTEDHPSALTEQYSTRAILPTLSAVTIFPSPPTLPPRRWTSPFYGVSPRSPLCRPRNFLSFSPPQYRHEFPRLSIQILLTRVFLLESPIKGDPCPDSIFLKRKRPSPPHFSLVSTQSFILPDEAYMFLVLTPRRLFESLSLTEVCLPPCPKPMQRRAEFSFRPRNLLLGPSYVFRF